MIFIMTVGVMDRIGWIQGTNFGNEETQSFEIARGKQVVIISDELLRGQAFIF